MNIKRIVTTSYQENCYVVWDDNNKCAVIDPGGNSEKIIDFIKENNLSVQCIMQTHGHFDHIGATSKLSKLFKVCVYMSKEEMTVVNDPENKLDVRFEIPDNISFIKENDIVTVGNIEFKVIQTPGHTIGSVCFLCEKTLFSGDTLFLNTVGRWDFYTGSLDKLKDSVIDKLFLLDDDVKVYPGHGFTTMIGNEKYDNGILGF